MPTCETCKWWGPRSANVANASWRKCWCHKTAQRVSSYPKFHKNFGCIHHQPKEAEDE